MPADGLAAFIADLRGRLERGELADHPPIDLGNALTLGHVERAVRRTLQDVEMFRAMDPAERALPHFRRGECTWRTSCAGCGSGSATLPSASGRGR